MISLVAQMVKRLPTVQETRVRSLGWEYPLEKEMTTHSNNGNPLQYSCLENAMDGGGWWATVCGVAKKESDKLSDFTFTFTIFPPPSLGSSYFKALSQKCHTPFLLQGVAALLIKFS